jgi:uncharacterized cysteine cluster protein YcgN (CxxCxxCC family)
MTKNTGFWTNKPMTEFSYEEWESLCDGCGKCCLIKLEDVDSGEIHYTDVGCTLLDGKTCLCRDYANRKQIVPDCVILTPDRLEQIPWMPQSCSYRLIYEGKDLPDWHPLITSDPNSTHQAGQSVAGQIISEDDIDEDDLPTHIKDWNR